MCVHKHNLSATGLHFIKRLLLSMSKLFCYIEFDMSLSFKLGSKNIIILPLFSSIYIYTSCLTCVYRSVAGLLSQFKLRRLSTFSTIFTIYIIIPTFGCPNVPALWSILEDRFPAIVMSFNIGFRPLISEFIGEKSVTRWSYADIGW